VVGQNQLGFAEKVGKN